MSTLGLVDRLLGNAEIRRAFGISRQRLSQLTARPDFPAPRVTLTMGSIWTLGDLQQWADATGRTLDVDAIDPDPLDEDN